MEHLALPYYLVALFLIVAVQTRSLDDHKRTAQENLSPCERNVPGTDQKWLTMCEKGNAICVELTAEAECKCFEDDKIFMDGACREKNDPCKQLKDPLTTWDSYCNGINSTCSENNGSATCLCPDGKNFDGTDCTGGPDPCFTMFSGHIIWVFYCRDIGGRCESSDGTATCVCPPGQTFEGDVCKEKNPCEKVKDLDPKTTWNSFCGEIGGTCSDIDGNATCECQGGKNFNGTDCTGSPDPCFSMVNGHVIWLLYCADIGGQCDSTGGTATCVCPPGKVFQDDTCKVLN